MTDPIEELPRIIPWERHLQSVLAAIIIALMLWVGSSIQGQSIQIAKLQVQEATLQTQLATLLGQTQQSVSAASESADVARLQAQIDGISSRLRHVEEDVAADHPSAGG